MIRLLSIVTGLALTLSACTTQTLPPGTSGGKPLPKVYKISSSDSAKIQFRVLDSVNSLRKAAGLQQVKLNSELNAAAATHSRDMSVQNRPWHFGSDGSSPLDRANRVGYRGRLTGENISETYETELETLAAWMDKPETRAVILDRTANELGIAWYQERGGKIWWTLVMGQKARGGL